VGGVAGARAVRGWWVGRENSGTEGERAGWWALFRGGATPQIADGDRVCVAGALALLPDAPCGDDTWRLWTQSVKEKTGRKGKRLFMPLRLAITGRARGPEMADVMPLLQKRPAL